MSAFKVHFKCKNCGNQFSWHFDEGQKVAPATSFALKDTVKVGKPSTTGGVRDGEKIGCPVCKLNDSITIEDREPIQNGIYPERY
jgi:hypothetical protein